jgi:hypothetical protein
MKKRHTILKLFFILVFFVINQLANAQTCPKGKIMVCGCEHYFHYVCKCVNENTADKWLFDHPCRGTGFLAASIENTSHQIFRFNVDSNFNWQMSSSVTPINNLLQNERLRANVWAYGKTFRQPCQIKWSKF